MFVTGFKITRQRFNLINTVYIPRRIPLVSWPSIRVLVHEIDSTIGDLVSAVDQFRLTIG